MSDRRILDPTVWQGRPGAVKIQDAFDVLQCRLLARELAEAGQASRADLSAVVTAVSELAYNLLFHACGQRRIVVGTVVRPGSSGIQIISEDEGPGIPDLTQALRDGFSTSGGLGGGLPAVRRLMDEFDIVSAAGLGTRIAARKWWPCR